MFEKAAFRLVFLKGAGEWKNKTRKITTDKQNGERREETEGSSLSKKLRNSEWFPNRTPLEDN